MRFVALPIKKISALTLLVGASCLVTLPSFAQDTQALSTRLRSLENEVQTLNRAVYKGGIGVGQLKASADAQVQQQEIEDKIRVLQGQVEEASHQARMVKRDLESKYEDLVQRLDEANEKIRKLEQQKATAYRAQEEARTANLTARPSVPQAPAQMQQPLSSPLSVVQAPASSQKTLQPDVPPSVVQPAAQGAAVSGQLPSPSATTSVLGGDSKARALAEYEQAFGLLKQGQYNSAQLHFETFLKNNSGHMLASNAKYWLGESHYVRGDYSQAARIFAEGFQEFPKGAKAPDNLLKLGLTLEKLGKKDDACIALKQVAKEFPEGAGAVVTRADKEMARIACQ